MKVSIIGGGVAGLSLALILARRGHKVILYEQEYPGCSATGRSAGIIVTIFEDKLLKLALESLDFYLSLPGADEIVKPKKALYLHKSGVCISKLLKIHKSNHIAIPDDVDPDLGVEFDYGKDYYAVIRTYLTDAGWTINTLYSEFLRHGGVIVDGPVERRGDSFYHSGNRIEGKIVISAGPWTRQLLPEIEDSTVIYRCQAASVEGPTPRMIIEDDALEYYLVPTSESRFVIGDGGNPVIKDPTEGFNPDPEDTYSVLERYARRVPEAWESRVVQMWAAPCITTGDSLPLAGKVFDDVYVLTGFDGAGISLAPAVARLLADELEGRGKVPNEFSRLERRVYGVVEPYVINC